MRKILVIEDNPSNMKFVRLLLEEWGFEVVEATTAEQGIELARGDPPDLIAMDIQLPGMDGLEAAKVLKEDDRTRGSPILALTAHAMSGDERRILDAGCDAYLSKPIRYRDLREKIDELMRA